MSEFRKKPVVIDAVLWDGDTASMGEIAPYEARIGLDEQTRTLSIHTLEGVMECRVGDYLIKGIKGEIYPIEADIFEATYEPA